jgi:peptidoglycan/LPS O-acetylase OafA/YrhL
MAGATARGSPRQSALSRVMRSRSASALFCERTKGFKASLTAATATASYGNSWLWRTVHAGVSGETYPEFEMRDDCHPKTNIRFDSLDLIRGLAALAVLSSHLRAYVFQNYVDLANSTSKIGVITKVFYFLTGLGHQSVMVFFALSGFLVGGTALSAMLSRKFSWPNYLTRRLTRLWIVIIPALALTLLFDNIGMKFSDGYDGRYYDIYSSGPHSPEGVSHSISTLVGNVLFMQTIEVPTFGSNGPLWSLANEFWYYLVFPILAWLIFSAASQRSKIGGLIILIILVSLLPRWLLEGGAIWVAGALAAWISRRAALLPLLTAIESRMAALALLFAALAISELPGFRLGDLGLGLSVAFTLPVMAHLPSPNGALRRVARGLSEMSYTLYLTHFPFLTLIVMVGFAPMKWPPGASAAGVYMALLFAAVAWAGVIWWCFERHTDRVYLMLSRKFPLSKVAKLAA